MKRYILALTAVLVANVFPACVHADVPYRRTVIYYDQSTSTYSRGVAYPMTLCNLLGHFKTSVDMVRADTYSTGQMASYEAVFYVGSDFSAPLSAAFLADVSTATNTVVWMNYGIWQLLRSTNNAARLGLHYLYPTNGFDAVAYKGDWLYAHPNGSAIAMSPSNNVTVLASWTSRVDTARAPIPYVMKSSNFWYVADNPFQNATLCDRSLVFADLLHDMLGAQGVTGFRGLARIEDIAPALTDMSGVARVAAGLTALGVSGTYGIIPRYRDPLGQYTNEWPADLPMNQNRAFLRQVRSLVRNGAFLAAHGYTHESGDGASAAGWEFWNYAGKTPLTIDNWAWAEARVTNSANEFLTAGFPVECWETPHYQASLVDYFVFSAHYRLAHERAFVYDRRSDGLSREALDALSATSSNAVAQWLPYTVYRNRCGSRTLPENLDRHRTETNDFDSNGLTYSISNKVEYARKFRVVRDAVAGFYYHPGHGVEPITNLVAQMQSLGYTFVSPETLAREEAVAIHTNPVPGESDGTRLFSTGITNLVADLVLGDLAGNNTLSLLSGAVVSNEEAFIGLGVSSLANTLMVSGTGSTWVSAQTVFVGYRGSQNLVGVTTNGTVNAMDTVIGMETNARANGFVVTGAGAAWSNRYGVTVGQAGTSNAIYVLNGGHLQSQYGELGATRDSLGNLACVSGVGSLWTLDNYLSVGNGGSGNWLDLLAGGKVESAFGLIGVGNTACSNRVTVANPGTVWSNRQRLCVGVDGSWNRLEVRDGSAVSCAALVIGDYSLAASNEVTVKDAGSLLTVSGDLIVGADGPGNRLVVEAGASVTCGNVVIGQYSSSRCNEIVLSGAASCLTVSNSSGPGAVSVLNGKLRVEGGIVTAGSLLIGPGGQLEIPSGASNATLHLAGDFSCSGTNRALNLLGLDLAFSTPAAHRLDVNSRDQGASLQGFVTNRAVGRVDVGGAVTVTNVCYAWELSGSGTITVANGAVLYYVNGSNWSGSVSVLGSGRFVRIPVMLNRLSPLTNDAWQVKWDSASGLCFRIEWTGSLLESEFQPATNLIGTGGHDAWVDTGGDARPAPGLTTQRFYRVKAWPSP